MARRGGQEVEQQSLSGAEAGKDHEVIRLGPRAPLEAVFQSAALRPSFFSGLPAPREPQGSQFPPLHQAWTSPSDCPIAHAPRGAPMDGGMEAEFLLQDCDCFSLAKEREQENRVVSLTHVHSLAAGMKTVYLNFTQVFEFGMTSEESTSIKKLTNLNATFDELNEL
ncbi:hypothetical protein JD844_024482 [Phrynosoma platyrhinos]|uniref:Uncharacterized protein n=1 Tax=Phrynosoma platyrhinos TaxID=52577 RepID=A0ABQ7SY11_PHRPL|nr:hypothetical protein JD844_024482 [Phrynosoma platyrhinos]